MIRSNVNFPVSDVQFSSLPPDKTVSFILEFLGIWFPVFREEYINAAFSLKEDEISRELHSFLQSKATELLFRFNEKKGVDFQILIKPFVLWAKPIFVIEAKRLPPTNPRDYVQGDTGGIERFKRERAGFVLERNHCAMVAYVQRNTFEYWFEQINQWLTELISINQNSDECHWEENDKLVSIASNTTHLARYISNHSRRTLSRLVINHFWLDMYVDKPTGF